MGAGRMAAGPLARGHPIGEHESLGDPCMEMGVDLGCKYSDRCVDCKGVAARWGAKGGILNGQLQHMMDPSAALAQAERTLLAEELPRAAAFMRAKVDDVHRAIVALARSLAAGDAGSGKGHTGAFLGGAERDADAAAEEVVHLGSFWAHSRAALLKLADLADSAQPPPRNGASPRNGGAHAPVGATWREKIACHVDESELARAGGELDALVVALSDIYAEIRRLGQAGPGAGGEEAAGDAEVWAPPDTFVRATTKYWVRPGEELRVKVGIIKHLPVLLFGQSREERLGALACPAEPRAKPGRRRTAAAAAAAAAAPRVPGVDSAQAVESVYLDSPRLEVYGARLMRHDGASLVRLRWYGAPTGGGGSAGGDRERVPIPETVYVEKKVHREKWTGERSVKERAPLPAHLIPELLRPPATPAAGSALGEFIEGGPRKRGEILRGVWEEQVGAGRQVPFLRTRYHRTAFQEATTNAVRISMDTALCFEAETIPGQPPPPPGPPPRAEFPYAVVEVKLQEEAPPWVEELIQGGALVKAPKFSKFLHGMAMLHSETGAGISTLPYWFVEEGAGVEPGAAGAAHPGGPGSTRSAMVPASIEALSASHLQEELEPSRSSPSTTSSADGNNGSLGTSNGYKRSGKGGSTPSTTSSSSAPAPAPAPSWGGDPRRGRQVAIDIPKEPLFPSAAEVAEWGARKGAGGGAGKIRGKIQCWGGGPRALARKMMGRKGGGRGRKGGAQALVRTRVEPKTFFANERTFLSWLSISVLIMFTALSLLAGGTVSGGAAPVGAGGATSTGGGFTATKICGLIVAPVSVLFMGYALFMYHKRNRQIMARQVVRYDDERGPTMLVLLLAGVTITSYVISLASIMDSVKLLAHA